MLADSTLPNGALEGVLDFVSRLPLQTETARDSLALIIGSTRPDALRSSALSAFAKAPGSTDAIAALRPSLTGQLLEAAEDHLIDGQHRATIQRRLAELIDDPTLLVSANVELHFRHPLEWIGKISLPEPWNQLRDIRRLALERGLEYVVPVVTRTMAAIDSVRLARVILDQLPSAPASRHPMQRIQALEFERDGKIRAAQMSPFDQVIERLRAFSSMNRFKLWVEGPNDVPPFQRLTDQLAGVAGNVVVQPIGGWAQVLSDNWSPRGLGDGCSDLLVLFDGDRAYDWTKPTRPLRKEIRGVIAKLEKYGIDRHILERYAIENYLPQHAFESVLGVSLSAHFPLDPARPLDQQVPGYRKEMNGAIAAATTINDLQGTDLGDVLERIRLRVAG